MATTAYPKTVPTSGWYSCAVCGARLAPGCTALRSGARWTHATACAAPAARPAPAAAPTRSGGDLLTDLASNAAGREVVTRHLGPARDPGSHAHGVLRPSDDSFRRWEDEYEREG